MNLINLDNFFLALSNDLEKEKLNLIENNKEFPIIKNKNKILNNTYQNIESNINLEYDKFENNYNTFILNSINDSLIKK